MTVTIAYGSHRRSRRVCSVAMAEGVHPIPFRTRKLSPPAPMVLPRRGWESRSLLNTLDGFVASLTVGRPAPSARTFVLPGYRRGSSEWQRRELNPETARRGTMRHQMPSTIPNGRAPDMKRYEIDKAQPSAKPTNVHGSAAFKRVHDHHKGQCAYAAQGDRYGAAPGSLLALRTGGLARSPSWRPALRLSARSWISPARGCPRHRRPSAAG